LLRCPLDEVSYEHGGGKNPLIPFSIDDCTLEKAEDWLAVLKFSLFSFIDFLPSFVPLLTDDFMVSDNLVSSDAMVYGVCF
jgi:hypothetical protein